MVDYTGLEIFDGEDLPGRSERLRKTGFEIAFEGFLRRGAADRKVAAIVVALAGGNEFGFFVAALLLRIGTTRC